MTDMDRRAFGATLKQYREAAGLTLKALGVESGDDPQKISAWEQGEWLPTRERLPETCRWLQERLGIPDRLLERYAGLPVDDRELVELRDLGEKVDALSQRFDQLDQAVQRMAGLAEEWFRRNPNGRG